MRESCCHTGQVLPLSVGILTCELEQTLNLQPASFTRFSGFAAQQRKGSEGNRVASGWKPGEVERSLCLAHCGFGWGSGHAFTKPSYSAATAFFIHALS